MLTLIARRQHASNSGQRACDAQRDGVDVTALVDGRYPRPLPE